MFGNSNPLSGIDPNINAVQGWLDITKHFLDNATSIDPVFILFFIVVGGIIGYTLGWLFTGVGKTEQRLIGSNYGAGYRKGWNDRAKQNFDLQSRHKW